MLHIRRKTRCNHLSRPAADTPPHPLPSAASVQSEGKQVESAEERFTNISLIRLQFKWLPRYIESQLRQRIPEMPDAGCAHVKTQSSLKNLVKSEPADHCADLNITIIIHFWTGLDWARVSAVQQQCGKLLLLENYWFEIVVLPIIIHVCFFKSSSLKCKC